MASAINFTERQTAAIMRDLFSACATLHHNRIIHRDIKLDNICFRNLNNVDTAKLIDLGSAIWYEPGEKYYERAGDLQYCSPEMMRLDGYTEKTDIWSLGIVFFFLLT